MHAAQALELVSTVKGQHRAPASGRKDAQPTPDLHPAGHSSLPSRAGIHSLLFVPLPFPLVTPRLAPPSAALPGKIPCVRVCVTLCTCVHMVCVHVSARPSKAMKVP